MRTRRGVTLIAICMILAACGGGDTTDDGAAPDPSESVAPTDPLEGRWETARLTQDEVVDAFVAAGGSSEVAAGWYAELGGGPEVSDYVVFGLNLLGGEYVEIDSGPDGPPIEGDEGFYEVVDEGTLRLGNDGCMSTYDYEADGTTLEMSVSEACESQDAPFASTLYGSFPFTRVG